jgi:hypothetical protein
MRQYVSHPDCRATEHRLTVTFRSSRPFGTFAEGLIAGCIAHFGESINYCSVSDHLVHDRSFRSAGPTIAGAARSRMKTSAPDYCHRMQLIDASMPPH